MGEVANQSDWIICETSFFFNKVVVARGFDTADTDAGGALRLSSGGEAKKIYPRGTWKSVERYSDDALKRAKSWAHWNFW